MAFSYVDTLGFKDAINSGKPLKPTTQFTINCLGAGEQVGTVMAINAAGIATACTVVTWTDTLLTLIAPPNIVEGVGYRVEVTLYGENIPAYYGETRADTFADLRTIEPTIENQIIMLLGDNGGNFQYIAGSTKTDDGKDYAVTADDKVWARISTNIQKKPLSKIVIFGASIMEQSFSLSNSKYYTELAKAKYGLSNVEVKVIAVSGYIISEIKDAINTELSAITSNERVLFIGQAGGNDVSETRPFSTASETRLYGLGSDVQTIIKNIQSAGHDVIFARLSYRQYTTVFPDQSYGSLPYNDNIIEPAIRANNPDYFNFTSGHSVLDYYALFENNPSLLESDGIHPNAQGEDAVRDLTFSVISNYFKSNSVPYEPIIGETFVLDFKFDESAENTNPLIYSVMGTGQLNRVFSPTSKYGVTSLISYNTGFTDSAGTGRGNTGDVSATLTNNELLSDFWFVSNGESDRIFTFNNVKAGATANIKITASRNVVATDRIGEWTYNGITKTLDASNNAASPAQIIEFDVIFDNNGVVEITHSIPATSSFAYLSGMQLEFT